MATKIPTNQLEAIYESITEILINKIDNEEEEVNIRTEFAKLANALIIQSLNKIKENS